jgi:hypothetical protein
MKAVHPHMRGANVPAPLMAKPHQRFIPTCVGLTWSAVMITAAAIAVHPHMRGANARERFASASGFIPTCVGLTYYEPLVRGPLSVHPHMRGANALGYRVSYCSGAVHPHMRGANDYRRNVFSKTTRFIPTCVGLTSPQNSVLHISSGSSPHAWG